MILKKNRLITFCLYATSLLMVVRCSSSDEPEPVDCNTVSILIETETSAPTGCDASDGTVTVTASGGTVPYQYAINNGGYSNDNIFEGLAPGTYTLRVKDNNGCEQNASVTILATSSNLAFTASVDESGCKTSEGTIAISATGGSSSYEYRLNEGTFASTSDFTGLGAGTYTVTVRDSEG